MRLSCEQHSNNIGEATTSKIGALQVGMLGCRHAKRSRECIRTMAALVFSQTDNTSLRQRYRQIGQKADHDFFMLVLTGNRTGIIQMSSASLKGAFGQCSDQTICETCLLQPNSFFLQSVLIACHPDSEHGQRDL